MSLHPLAWKWYYCGAEILLFSLNAYSFTVSGNCCHAFGCYVTSLSAQTPHCKKSNAVHANSNLRPFCHSYSTCEELYLCRWICTKDTTHPKSCVKSLRKRRMVYLVLRGLILTLASKIYGLLLHVVSHDWWAHAVCSGVKKYSHTFTAVSTQ